MTRIRQFSASTLDLDGEGFLRQQETWSKKVAQFLAQGEVGKLADEHWKIIDYVRRYYIQFGSPPPVRALRKDLGVNSAYIRQLFPSGLAKGVCKIAGIPGDIVRLYGRFLY